MCAGSAIAGTSSSSQSPPNNEFETDNRLHNAIRTARMCRVRKGSGMARLVFGMNQSLDGYVDHMAFAPSPTLFRYFIE